MARIAGIATSKDAKGNLASITINVKKHPEALAVLQKIGLVEKSALRQEVETNPEKFMSIDECFDGLKEHIKTFPWKKK